MRAAYILKAVRTPGCKAKRGKFANVRPDYLGIVCLKGLLEKTGVEHELIEDVIVGCSFPEAEQGMNVGRMIVLGAGLPHTVPGVTVNRFCSSGLQTIAMAAERVMAGFADCIIAGGVESMTKVPMEVTFSVPILILYWTGQNPMHQWVLPQNLLLKNSTLPGKSRINLVMKAI